MYEVGKNYDFNINRFGIEELANDILKQDKDNKDAKELLQKLQPDREQELRNTRRTHYNVGIKSYNYPT